MKKLGVLLFLAVAMTLLLGGNALAQGDNSVYFVTYYSNANTIGAPDAVVRLINDGDASTTQVEGVPNGNLWASFYVFDIVKALRGGDKIEIRGFGSFRTRQRQPRIGRNPKTGTRVEVPAKKIPFFKPSKELKDLVNDAASIAASAAPPAPAAPAPPTA
jgi:integration host factor subunit beta